MKGLNINIEKEKEIFEKNNFRKVIYTSKHSQLVLMSLLPNEDIGLETHQDNDQFFRFESGQGKCVINGNEHHVFEDDTIIVPAGAEHHVINTSDKKILKFYTIYSPHHHKGGIIRITNQDAEAKENEKEFDMIKLFLKTIDR